MMTMDDGSCIDDGMVVLTMMTLDDSVGQTMMDDGSCDVLPFQLLLRP